MKQHVAISLPHRMAGNLVADKPLINEKILLIRLTPRVGGQRNPTF
jgi:hypothetical protein